MSTTAAGGDQDLVGNAAVAERLGGGGLYASLRERVGDALADLIFEHLSEDDLLSYITPSLEALVERARAAGSNSDHGLSDADLETAFSEMDQTLSLAAAQVLGRLQVDTRLARVVQDQPELALATALAGVVIWALSNPDLPALSLSSKLGGGHALTGSVDFGRLQSLAVDRLAVEWSWSSDDTSAKLEGFGGSKDGGWGAKGAVSHALGDGAALDGQARYFHGTNHREASGRLAYDSAKTDASLEGNWTSGEGGTEWGLGALLTHDGTHTDGSLEARLAKDLNGDRTGHLAGSLTRETDNWTGHLSGRAGLDGSWNAAGGIGNTARTDQPWSLTGTLGQSALDTEADWSVTGRYARNLDKDGQTVLSGSQMMGRDRSATKLDLTHNWEGGSASGYVERSRSELGTVDALGGSLEAQVGDNLRAYGQGWVRSDDSWDVSAGIRSGTEEDQSHWFAEGFSAKERFGDQDQGVRAGFRLRF